MKWNCLRKLGAACLPVLFAVSAVGTEPPVIGQFKGTRVGFQTLENGWRFRLIQKSPEGIKFNGNAGIVLPLEIRKGEQYQINFKMKSSRPMSIKVDWKQGRSPWLFVGARIKSRMEFEVGVKEKEYSLTVAAIQSFEPKGTRLNFYFGDNPTGSEFTVTDLRCNQLRKSIPLDLTSVANFDFADEVAGDGKGGWSDQGAENDFKNFPVGRQTFLGIPFEIIDARKNNGRAILSFESNKVKTGLSKAEIILPESRRYLYLLHTATWTSSQYANPETVGNVIFEGRVEASTYPILDGRDVANWWNARDLSLAKVAYKAAPNGTSVGVYLSRISVPLESERVTLQNSDKGDANWIVLGATLSDEEISAEQKKWTVTAGKEWRPIPLKPYITRGSALDLASEREVAGTSGRAIVRPDGKLAFEKKQETPVRLYGYNFVPHRLFGWPVFWSKLPEKDWKAKVDEFADGVVTSGFNALRWHLLDYTLIYHNRRTNRKELLPGKPEDIPLSDMYTDMFLYLFDALKRRGIYSMFDLNTSPAGWTEYYPWDRTNPVVGDRRNYRNRLYYDQEYRRNWAAGVTRLLTMVNPYSKTALKDDPALVCVTFVNEQYFAWNPRDLAALDGEWQTWMNKKYNTRKQWPKLNKFQAQKGGTPGLDMAEFIAKKECDMMDFFIRTVRGIGYPGLVSNDICFTLSRLNAFDKMDVIAWHPYFCHPDTVGGIRYIAQDSSLGGAPINAYRLFGKPLFITEYNHLMWNAFRHESPVRYPTIAALQDWSTFFPHQDAVMPIVKRMEPFELSYDPMGRAQSILGYFSFFRQDVTPHSARVAVHVRPDELRKYGESSPSHSLGLLAYLAQFGMVYDKGDKIKLDSAIMPDMLVSAAGAIRQPGAPVPRNEAPASISALVNQLRRKKLLPQDNPTNPDKGLYQSANGEVTIDMRKHEMKVATPRLEMCAYKKTAPLPIRNLTILHSSIPASFAAVSLDESRPLNTSGRILLCVATDALNSGMTFDSAKREGLLNAGELPALLRCGQFRMSLKSTLKNPVLYSLNCSGDRLEKLPAVKHQDTIRIDLDTTKLKEPAIFFELVEGI